MKIKLLTLVSVALFLVEACFGQTRPPRERSNFSEKQFDQNTPHNIDSEFYPISDEKETKPILQNEEKSANGNCINAATLTTAGAALCYNFSTDNFESGESTCVACGGYTKRSIWYKFEATSANTTLNFNTNDLYWADTWSIDNIAVYGPYTSMTNATANCIPPVSQRIFCLSDYTFLYDPLYSYSLATTSGSFYLLQITNCEESTDTYWHTGCVWINPTPSNNTPSGSAGINQCGTVFNGSNIGYSPSNGYPGNENIDNNASTTCSGCTAGENVPYIINNDSWFYFCATAAGTYNVNFSGISGCINNEGLQMSILRGTPTNLTTVWNAANPSLPGSSQTSSNFSVTAGECIYMIVDGFAGDQCNYSYTLNAVSSPCNLNPLPAELDNFIGYNENAENVLRWITASELNSKEFIIKKSVDGQFWSNLVTVPAAVSSNESKTYKVMDRDYEKAINYYKLIQIDQNGVENWSKIISIDNTAKSQKILYSTNIMGQKIDAANFEGIIIDVYEDGSTHKRFK